MTELHQMSREELFGAIKQTLADMFELEPDSITPTAGVFEDLDLDSIDAIDLVAKLQEMTGRRVSEEEMRGVRTVDDIVGIVQGLAKAAHEAGGAP